MANTLLSYARADRPRAQAVAAAMEDGGGSLRSFGGPAPADDEAGAELGVFPAQQVLVAWSASARHSLRVRAEANEALDQRKLVQVVLDRSAPPFPFDLLDWSDLSAWSGHRAEAPWPEVARRLEGHTGMAAGARRPDPGGIALAAAPEPALQGLGKATILGWAAIATATVLALSVLMVARGLMSAGAFAVIGIAGLGLAVLLLAAAVFLIIRTERATRR